MRRWLFEPVRVADNTVALHARHRAVDAREWVSELTPDHAPLDGRAGGPRVGREGLVDAVLVGREGAVGGHAEVPRHVDDGAAEGRTANLAKHCHVGKRRGAHIETGPRP